MEELAPLAIAFEPRLERAVVRWAQLTPWQRRFVMLEDLAAHAGLTPGEFLAAVVRASFKFTENITDLIVASALPEVVVASVKRALTPNGIEDRWLLLEHMGFLRGPQPTGSAARNGSTVATANAGPTCDSPPAA